MVRGLDLDLRERTLCSFEGSSSDRRALAKKSLLRESEAVWSFLRKLHGEEQNHKFSYFLVTKAERPHLFPSRTQQLSSPAAMVLPHLVVGE
jgi:hypothetical protein